jgi:hypothetical protein
MTYSTDGDLELAFGRTNVRKWADVNNDGVAADVAARLEWAREAAYAELNDRLRKSPYQFPLAEPGSGDAYPATVVRMEAYLAGVLLYESRGVTDVNQVTGQPIHALMWHRRAVDRFVTDLCTRRMTLDVEPPVETSETPAVVNRHVTDDDWTAAGEEGEQWPAQG